MEIKDTLIIAKEFADNPGARDIEDGDNSGEAFLKDIFYKRFDKAVSEQYILLVDLDGVLGYPSSFLSGSFGRLSMERGKDILLRHLQFKSEKNSIRIDKVMNEINNPITKR